MKHWDVLSLIFIQHGVIYGSPSSSCVQLNYAKNTASLSLPHNITATEARKSFFDLIKQSNQTHEIFEVQHKSGNAILMSADEYESLQETLYLLSQPQFKEDFSEAES
jgi:antitoxin YefM